MYATIVYRLLYDLALDLFDRPNVSMSAKSPSLSRQVSGEPQVLLKVHSVTKISMRIPGYKRQTEWETFRGKHFKFKPTFPRSNHCTFRSYSRNAAVTSLHRGII